jgi:hypothetical protein
MHDIGRIALAAIQPEEYARFLQSGQKNQCEALNREREIFGVDHCELGRLLVIDWNLPRQFVDITSRHHETTDGSKMSDVLDVVRFSCRMADAIGFGAAPSFESCYKELLNEISKWGATLFPASPEELAFRIATKVSSIESA